MNNPIEIYKVEANAGELARWKDPAFAADMRAQYEHAAWVLAERYRVDPATLIESIADDEGVVRFRATTAPTPRFLFHPSPTTTVERIFAGGVPFQRARLQLGRMEQALWGLGLRWGCPLQGYPRDAQPAPEDIPWGLVDWMESDARAFQHVRICGMRLREFSQQRFKKDCAAGKRIGWLIPRVNTGTLPVLAGPLQPPRWDVRRLEARSA